MLGSLGAYQIGNQVGGNNFMRRVGLKSLFLVIVIAFVCFCGLNSIRRNLDSLSDGYAKYAAAVMLIDFMQQNDGKWPSGWNDLAIQYEKFGKRISGESFEGLKVRVVVDFEFDPSTQYNRLLLDENSPNRVVYARNSNSFHVVGDANALIYDFLRSGSAEHSGNPR